jgi:hypothetical protein
MSFGLGLNVSQANFCVDSFARLAKWCSIVTLGNGCVINWSFWFGVWLLRNGHFVSRYDFSQGQMCCTRIAREMVVLPTNLKKWDMLSKELQCFEQHNHFVVAQHIDHLLISSSKKLDLPSKFTIFTNNQIM